jgi:hypothetical protein
MHGLEQYTSLHVISSKVEIIKLWLWKIWERNPIIKGERYLPDTFDLRTDWHITVVTRLQLLRIKDEIKK